MGAVATPDTSGFIHPNGLFAKSSTKNRLTTGSDQQLAGKGLESKCWIQGLFVGQNSGVPASHNQLNGAILCDALLGHLEALFVGRGENRIEGIALRELGQEAFDRNRLLPQVKVGNQLIGTGLSIPAKPQVSTFLHCNGEISSHGLAAVPTNRTFPLFRGVTQIFKGLNQWLELTQLGLYGAEVRHQFSWAGNVWFWVSG